jgi:hypothetical protein
MSIGEVVVQMLGVNAFLSMLGWLFASAMLVGGILDDDYRSLLRWLLAGTTYVVFQEIARSALIHDMSTTAHSIGFIISIITLIVYSCGFALGWGITAVAKTKARRQVMAIINSSVKAAQDASPNEDQQEMKG